METSAETLVVDERGIPIASDPFALPAAKEIRERAWRALGGKWGTCIGAVACMWGIVVVVSILSGTLSFFGLIVQHYFNAVFYYGIAVLSIAVMRGGVEFNHVFSGFGRGWRTLWLMGISQCLILLWSLLLIVPGIMAACSYAMVYFIRVDRPELSAMETIAESKRLMCGHRWRYFCMCFSFVGWWLLCIPTLGLAIFFLIPYVNAAQAAFYEDLLDRDAGAGTKVVA